MPVTKTLWRAYRDAHYQVNWAGRFERVRPDGKHAFLDDLLGRFTVGTWAIITACNPRSERLRPDVNARRQQALETDCDRMGLPRLHARGGDPQGRWGWEESYLILGLLRTEALVLGRRYGQNAILFGQRRGPALLLDCQAIGRSKTNTKNEGSEPMNHDAFEPLYELFPATEIPFLERAKLRLRDTRPYQGLKILHNVPLTMESLHKVHAILLGGAEVTVTSPSFMEPKEEAIALLRRARNRCQSGRRASEGRGYRHGLCR